MTIVSHEREPGEVGYVSRYLKMVKELETQVQARTEAPFTATSERRSPGPTWRPRCCVFTSAAGSPSGSTAVDHGPGGSVDKLLMTWTEQSVGHAALAVSGSRAAIDGDEVALKVYLYSRAQSVMGGTSQIQKNIIAQRILGLPAS